MVMPPNGKETIWVTSIGGHTEGSEAATEVTAQWQNLPKRIYPKVNTYTKNTMNTAAEENNVF